jgi:hypothetical protein
MAWIKQRKNGTLVCWRDAETRKEGSRLFRGPTRRPRTWISKGGGFTIGHKYRADLGDKPVQMR